MEGFIEISIILALATAVSWLMYMLHQPLILGHILTGIIAGPIFLNLIESEELLILFSKIGITALLFIVGLSLSPKVAKEVGRISLIAGITQVVFTSGVGFLIASIFGFGLIPSLFIAIALTFSSTIIIMKLLGDKKDLSRLYGKIAIGILLVQDVIATIILIVISASQVGTSVGSEIALVFVKLVVVGLLLVFISKAVLPALSRAFASSQEFLFLFSVSWCLGMAALFHVLGFSIEIGALIAGVTLAASPYHYEISAKMKLIRDFFIVLFFILLGAQINFYDISTLWQPALVLSLFVLIGNPLILLTIMGIMGYHRKTAFQTGLTVAQISEFSLVLILLSHEMGYVNESVVALVTFIGLITISLSSYMISSSDILYKLFDPILKVFERKRVNPQTRSQKSFEAILFGCHRLGQDFLPVLKSTKRPYLIVDFNPEVIHTLNELHIPARYGDADDNEFLDELDLKKLKLLISTVPDPDSNEFLVHKVRSINKRAVIIANAHNVEQALYLYGIGANYVIMPHYLGGNYASLLVGKHGMEKKYFEAEKTKHIKHLKSRHMPMLRASALSSTQRD